MSTIQRYDLSAHSEIDLSAKADLYESDDGRVVLYADHLADKQAAMEAARAPDIPSVVSDEAADQFLAHPGMIDKLTRHRAALVRALAKKLLQSAPTTPEPRS